MKRNIKYVSTTRKQIPHEFYVRLPQIRKKIFPGKINRFGICQYWLGTKKFQYSWNNRSPINQDFEDHWFKDGINLGNRIEGALGFLPLLEDNIITKVTIDADDANLRRFCFEKIIPKYDEMGIDWFLEHGRANMDRCHLSTI